MTVLKQGEELNILLGKMDEVIKAIDKQNVAEKMRFLDNQEFIQMMNISKRTAQTWRDEGRVSFSQVGCKIYYQMKDIEAMLENNIHPTKQNTISRK